MHMCFNIQDCCLQDINFLIRGKPGNVYQVKTRFGRICVEVQSWVGRRLIISLGNLDLQQQYYLYLHVILSVLILKATVVGGCSQAVGTQVVWESNCPTNPNVFTLCHLLPAYFSLRFVIFKHLEITCLVIACGWCFRVLRALATSLIKCPKAAGPT